MASILGTRGYWVYQSDVGNTYNIKLRDADAAAVGNSVAARGANPTKPTSLKVRGVWTVNSTGGRRFFPVGDTSNGYYTGGGVISVDGDSWTVTGRKGERDQGSVTE